MNTNKYFKHIQKEVKKEYEIAKKARAVGIDPISKIETQIAMSLAEKAVGIVSSIYPQLNDKKVVNRIIELEKEHGSLDVVVCFKIAEEIAKEKFCKFESLLQAIEAGIRVGFAYFTLGIVSSPIEGFTGLKLGKTKEGKEYFITYFSGPIRSAGTTATCIAMMIIDYLRELFGFAKYDPTNDEVKRYISENYDYHERVTNLQYLPTEEEIEFLAKNIPIQISGEPTEKKEVSNYKDLPRVETNFIRGGMCLAFSEGLAQKAQKGFGLLKGAKKKGIKSTGWDFLEEFVQKFKMAKKGEGGGNIPVYIKDLVAGRPVYSHPSRSGGFRFRYGRCRTSGFSAMAIHPATMAVSDSFLSFGTQLKIEKPTKGCAVSTCGDICGPIVRLKDGSVKKINDFEEAKRLYKNIDEIIYLGDLLVSFGDIVNRFYDLLKPGYVEEWWEFELKKKAEEKGDKIKVDKFNVSFEDAVEFSKKYAIALHPDYIYYWKEISYGQFLSLLDFLSRGIISEKKLILPYAKTDRERFSKGKRALELIGCEHKISIENIILNEKDTKAILFNLGVGYSTNNLEGEFDRIIRELYGKKIENVLDAINAVCRQEIKDKSGTFIGARMGRPEKAKLRKLTGSPHVLFPVGSEGGRLRSVQAAVEVGSVKGEFPIFYCNKCKEETVYPRCEVCNGLCKRLRYSIKEDKIYGEDYGGNEKLLDFKLKRIDIRHYFDRAKKQLGLKGDEVPLVKGVRGTLNEDHSCEHLTKGLLRAKYNLNVNKDGTIRYDMTEMVITHFKPKEVRTSIGKLRELGYEKDINGKELENEEQILEIFPHDIIMPSCPDSNEESSDKVFLKATQFIDDELEKIYGLSKFFNLKKKEGLIGKLVACIAPHICTASVGRIIGFSKTQTLLASPFMHAAMRRDADGDEAAVMLLMDVLLNFSRKFLPAHRGGTQDAPLVLNICLRAGDVDDQILDFETSDYNLELYELAEKGEHSSKVKTIEMIKDRLIKEKNPFVNIKFTHDCNDFNKGIVNSSYKSLPTMSEKVDAQMNLCTKIRAVDTSDVARLIIERHFIRDTRGNLRKFSMQSFRCVGCNQIYRRVPLKGRCFKCGGKLIFTIPEGGILKYMQPALDLAKKYDVSAYLLESLELTQMYIESIFGKEKEKQEMLGKWVG